MSPNIQINNFFKGKSLNDVLVLAIFFFNQKFFLPHAQESALGLLNLIMKQILRKWQKNISSILFNTHILIAICTTSFSVLNAEVVMHLILMMLNLMSDIDMIISGAPFKFL